MGAIKTETILLVGGGAVLLYFLMNKSTTTTVPPGMTMLPAGYSGGTSAAAIQAQASEQNTIVNDASANVTDLFNQLFG